MKSRAELAIEADKYHAATIKLLESKIAASMESKWDSVEYYCNEEAYLKLKPEIEAAGFRTKFLNLVSKCHSPKMVIYL